MAVAAGDGHPRLGQAQFRSDDVDDALPVVAEAGQAHAELTAIALERRNHVLGHHIQERPLPLARGHDVVDGRERAIQERHLPAVGTQRVEGLG
jgi:hypothetical protein